MDAGFETIGNATLICHDRGPVLATDPWVVGSAYFGSWVLSHEVPERQMEAVKACPYIWLSHGHPDHLSAESLELVRGRKILLPDHAGGRIARDLKEQGFEVHTMKDRRWYTLSPRIRALSIADYNQDAVLLVDVNGTLVVNLNDASDRGWAGFVRRTVREYPTSFLLALSGYGDAGMINMFDEEGERIPPDAARRDPVGQKISRLVEGYGTNYFVPFSSMHRYQREDSQWADPYSTRLSDYPVGFDARGAELLPAFIRYDAVLESLERIEPRELEVKPVAPEAFGDRWDEPLDASEAAKVKDYFKAIASLGEVLDFVNIKVGGRDNIVSFHTRHERGVTFEVPRQSLLTAVQFEIFDDLLIGNFMKTTLHGGRRKPTVQDHLGPLIGKYADNAGAKKPDEVRRYLAGYRAKDPLGFVRARVDRGWVRPAQDLASRELRTRLGADSRLFKLAKGAYWAARRAVP